MTAEVRQAVRYARRRGGVRRHDAEWHLRSYLRPAAAPVRPVLVIGCPRSGTTLLAALLRRHPELGGMRVEGHQLWVHQHPSRKGWASDRATADDIARDEARYLYAAIERIAGGRRFIDKTPKNAIRVPYLDALFPDASFVFIKRDGRANVASLIEGWTVRHGVSYRVPTELDLGAYRGRYWSYILPPGWRGVARSPVEEVAAFQYATTNRIALDDLEQLPQDRWTTVAFEALLDRPTEVAADVVERLGLAPSEQVARFASSLDTHQVSINSPPRPDKWRDRADQIERILPTIEPTMRRLGYAVEGVE